MLIVKLKDQLGNQMFAYAAIKNIAEKKGFDFKFYREPLNVKYINDSDKKYGNDLYTIFKLDEKEKIDILPYDYKIYKEEPLKKRFSQDYAENVFNMINDKMICDGHFIDTRFWADDKEKLKKWFAIPTDIRAKVELKKRELSHNGFYTLVSIHFRGGKDYTKLGYKLHRKYWWDAAQKVLSMEKNVRFVCVYDKKTKDVIKFIDHFNAIDFHGSLVEDMAMISECDINIVCNSTFSIMSALINPHVKYVICPNKYPTQGGYFPQSVFDRSWIRVPAKRSFISTICYIVYRFKTLIKG